MFGGRDRVASALLVTSYVGLSSAGAETGILESRAVFLLREFVFDDDELIK